MACPHLRAALTFFRTTYTCRCPQLPVGYKHDELLKIGEPLGLREMHLSPMDADVIIAPSTLRSADENPETKYLWVIATDDVPIALETPANVVLPLSKGRLTHTNLTGGSNAYSGGEMWFFDFNKVLINGKSGRYGPKTEEELNAMVGALQKAGYKAASMGWDYGVGWCSITLRDSPNFS